MPVLGESQGVKRYIRELAGALEALGTVDVNLFGAAADYHRRLQTLPKVGFGIRQAEQLVIAPLRVSRTADVLHYTEAYGPLISVSTPVVITIHDTTFITHRPLHKGWVHRWLTGLARMTWPRASALIAVSEVTAEDVVALGVPEYKVHVIPHGVDHVTLTAGGPPDGLLQGRYFAYLGNVEPRKDLPTLIAAFRRALPDLPDDIQLAIAGKHAWGPALDTAGVPPGRVKFLGWLSDDELARFMAHSLAFVYPSRYEGFGLPPLEALQLGAPVIVGDTPVARETLGGFASYFVPGNSTELAGLLVDALASPTRSVVGGEVRDHTMKYSWQAAAERTAEIYAMVCR